ncbi:hypothetical protein [Algibacter sp. L4_22]|uniref:hypothetical protein n=1 Tax=Algibacter sp. L4_22 TaxID=2942477 RepID=UPI00201B6EDE|nr:hypothetical protein [Algibacter sp. L4_22]MCL5129096.1 hypothetical protein [Algibacter sp. L4_22]
MNRKILILLSVFFLALTNMYASKDKYESPIQYQFIFKNSDTISIANTDKISLNSICSKIVNKKKILITAILSFKTGKQIKFNYSKGSLNSITMILNNKELFVPNDIIDKLEEINLQSVIIISGKYSHRELKPNYNIIQFDINTEPDFGKLPYIQLKFSDTEFNDAIIWKWTSKKSNQRFNL